MNARDALFEDIQALSDDADELGLTDVSLVLEFAMDVYLRETGHSPAAQPDTATQILERSAKALKLRHANNPTDVPRMGWSMSTFPLAQVYRDAS